MLRALIVRCGHIKRAKGGLSLILYANNGYLNNIAIYKIYKFNSIKTNK